MSVVATEAKTKPTAVPAAPGAALSAVGSAAGRRPAPPPRPGVADAETARALVVSVIRRIEGYLEEENGALDKSLDFDFKTSNDRKSQGLVDLNQALRRLQKSDANADLEKRLAAFRGKLALNLKKIRLHLDAVKEIAAILSDAIRDAESDGTYTRNIGPYRGAP